MDILKNTDAMGKRIFADLEKINFIRTSTSAEETRAANIIKDELAKEGMEAVIEEFMVETADIHKVSLKALGDQRLPPFGQHPTGRSDRRVCLCTAGQRHRPV